MKAFLFFLFTFSSFTYANVKCTDIDGWYRVESQWFQKKYGSQYVQIEQVNCELNFYLKKNNSDFVIWGEGFPIYPFKSLTIPWDRIKFSAVSANEAVWLNYGSFKKYQHIFQDNRFIQRYFDYVAAPYIGYS